MFRQSEFISGRGTVKKLAAVLASLILAFSAIFTFSNVAVSNAAVVYSNSIYDRIPVQTIVLDSDFTKDNLLLSSASGDYKYYNGGSYRLRARRNGNRRRLDRIGRSPR